MRKVLATGLMIITLVFFTGKMFAQSSSSDSTESTQPSVEARAEQILLRLNALQAKLKKEKDRASRLKLKKLKLITQGLVRAVNSIPPSRCLKRLKVSMNDLYGLVSELLVGISCGPSVIPPFFPEAKVLLSPDCIMPEEEITTDQLDDTFVELNPIYDDARELIKVDDNSNGISDVCEGALNSH